MWFGEPHPFPERGSPTGLSASEQRSYKGWSCRTKFWSFLAQFLFEWETFQAEVVEKIKNTHFRFSNFFFFENRIVCEMMWKNVVERGRPQIAMRRISIVCWITMATDTQDYKYLLLFHGNISNANAPLSFVHTYITCLVFVSLSADIDIPIFGPIRSNI